MCTWVPGPLPLTSQQTTSYLHHRTTSSVSASVSVSIVEAWVLAAMMCWARPPILCTSIRETSDSKKEGKKSSLVWPPVHFGDSDMMFGLNRETKVCMTEPRWDSTVQPVINFHCRSWSIPCMILCSVVRTVGSLFLSTTFFL